MIGLHIQRMLNIYHHFKRNIMWAVGTLIRVWKKSNNLQNAWRKAGKLHNYKNRIGYITL